MYKAHIDHYDGFFIEFREARSRGQLLGKFYYEDSASNRVMVALKDNEDGMFPTFKQAWYVMDVDFKRAGGDSTKDPGVDVEKFWAAWENFNEHCKKARNKWEMQSAGKELRAEEEKKGFDFDDAETLCSSSA
ncbi:hypothetical protein MY11210_004289 [Beauveria gryllotalpidicola]